MSCSSTPTSSARTSSTSSGEVVSRYARQNGVQGLRVADASVIPSIPSANTNATVYAIA
ncbi:GMC oxidoreductase [Planotetraspora thailandica]|uniref:GMC oxidoreductase n=1 Tax=Planotetraspora thailandica TaxID=487172 RepID=UPI001EF34906|nr:GMC oxidoreductase [Planotetraspora thailandica]